MSEPESKLRKTAESLAALERYFDGIQRVAAFEGLEAAKPDILSFDAELDLESRREDVTQKRRVNKTRLTLLRALFSLIVLWIVSVVVITVLAGFKWHGFELPEKVLITYITTTTATVFGLFYVAARWLFSKDN